MTQEMTGFGDSSGISWTICKQSAPHSRQITTPTPHHSIFTGLMLFLTPNQQCQSNDGTLHINAEEITEGRAKSNHEIQDHGTAEHCVSLSSVCHQASRTDSA